MNRLNAAAKRMQRFLLSIRRRRESTKRGNVFRHCYLAIDDARSSFACARQMQMKTQCARQSDKVDNAIASVQSREKERNFYYNNLQGPHARTHTRTTEDTWSAISLFFHFFSADKPPHSLCAIPPTAERCTSSQVFASSLHQRRRENS